MADETTASVIPLHQVPPKKKAKSSAERARTYKRRKKSPPVAKQAISPVTAERRLVAPVLLQIAVLVLAVVGRCRALSAKAFVSILR